MTKLEQFQQARDARQAMELVVALTEVKKILLTHRDVGHENSPIYQAYMVASDALSKITEEAP